MSHRVHIFLDDTKGIFKYLTERKGAGSIFDTRTLSFLRELHQEFAAEFTMGCIYRSGSFSLADVPDAYKNEFMANADWLHMGFHSFDEEKDYAEAGEEETIQDYRCTMEQLQRITGMTKWADVITLHRFAGNVEACRAFRRMGIQGLIAADDERRSYYLDEVAEERLRFLGMVHDEKENISFYRALPRIENSSDIVSEINCAIKREWKYIPVFTHEWQMDRMDIREKMYQCCEWVNRYQS